MPKLIATIAVILAITSNAVPAKCFVGESDDTTLTGVLERVTFPGPPNYESIKSGDQPETYFVLRLAKPVCFEESDGSVISAKRLQLFLDANQFSQYRPHLGRTIKLTGQLWAAETGHHHTPLMFTPEARENVR